MSNYMKRFLAALMALMLMPLAALAQSEPTATNADSKPYVLKSFEGTTLDLTQYEGKAIWLNFFTGWCPYCMTEMPSIKQVFDEYDPNEVAILLVHVWDGENADDSKKVIEKFDLQDMTMVEDQDMTLAGLVGLSGYPTSIFIDKQGYLQTVAYGLEYKTMVQYMEDLDVARRVTTAGSATVTATETPAATGL